MFCPNCGSQLPDTAKFCEKCGCPASAVPHETVPQPTQSVRPAVQLPVKPVLSNASVQSPPPQPQAFRFSAAAASGESVLGSIGGQAAGAASAALLSPGKVIANGVRGVLSSASSLFRDPKRILPVAALATVWLILNVLQGCGINPIPTRILSFFTFANGGMSGGFLGAVGGILGKGIFAGAVVSLIGLLTRKGGPKRSFTDTLNGAFGVSLDSLFAYLTGIGAALLFYLFISGGATRISFMGGVAASFVSARAALQNGFLRQFLTSLFAKKPGMGVSLQGILRGLAVGFGAAALLGLTGWGLLLVLFGVQLVVGGGVMLVLQLTGVVKLGKGAQV